MANPVAVPGSALAVTNTDMTRAEGIVEKIVQLIKHGSTGATNNTDPTTYPSPQPNPTTTTALELSTAEQQRLYRQIATALVQELINSDEVTTTPTADMIPRADGTGKIAAGWTVSSSTTRQAVSTATVLTGTANLHVEITGSFNGAITLPAATTAGQTITIVDGAGIGSGNSNGSGTDMVHVLCAGADVISTPTLNTPRSRLLLWRKYGAITLVADGTTGWRAVECRGWHIDPRTISNIRVWVDGRRGITLNGSSVSAWADISGNGLSFAQNTAVDQPNYRSAEGPHNSVLMADTSDHLITTASTSFASGNITVIGAFRYDWSRSAGTEVIFQSNPTGSLGFSWSVNNSTPPGAGASGSGSLTCNNTAGNCYRVFPRHFITNAIDAQVMMNAVGSGGQFGRMWGHPVGGSSATASVGAFTQTLRIGNSVATLRVAHLMAFDATFLSAADSYDIETALMDVWSSKNFG